MRVDITIPAQRLADGSADPNKDDETVTLSFPCEGEYGYRFWHDKCPFPEDGHGHVIFYDGGLTGRSPIPIDSLGFLAAVLGHAFHHGFISDEMHAAVVASPQAQKLPARVTDRERKLLADPKEFKRLFKGFGFVGA